MADELSPRGRGAMTVAGIGGGLCFAAGILLVRTNGELLLDRNIVSLWLAVIGTLGLVGGGAVYLRELPGRRDRPQA